ncbi:hypothetical protein M446_5798 [Methylobacterium sp. 4-46]|uniref:hypothetical protein n=1 Tax=unclassified Methylobacterium TaxID=2615210 RepID=UPI000152CE4C|nr:MULTISPECIES: hypothetical protein [Methylobacterium]ACA20085.1 hypothetical protein M446_5798 [Methylobacterium sp. 4-46]WFT79271.1 hypothetical protein QA634_29260 [Methylobacterium nodulans]
MIRTATLITALAALASYALVPSGTGAEAHVAPAAKRFTDKRFTERLPVASFRPEPQDIALFSLAGAQRTAARPCSTWPYEGARCVAEAPEPGVARVAGLARR